MQALRFLGFDDVDLLELGDEDDDTPPVSICLQFSARTQVWPLFFRRLLSLSLFGLLFVSCTVRRLSTGAGATFATPLGPARMSNRCWRGPVVVVEKYYMTSCGWSLMKLLHFKIKKR